MKNPEEKMSLPQFVAWCEASPQQHIRIIGNWADTIGASFETKAQWQVFIKRNLRPAKDLAPFDDKKISEAFGKLQGAVREGWLKKFTLETLLKFVL